MNNRRFSTYVKPIVFTLDLLLLNIFAFLWLCKEDFFWLSILFHVYISVVWFLSTLKGNFYDIHRYTNLLKIVNNVIRQSLIIFLFTYSYYGFFTEVNISTKHVAIYLFTVLGIIGFIRIILYYLFKRYRKVFKANLRRIVIIGYNKHTLQLKEYIENSPELGYKFISFITFGKNATFSSLDGCFKFIIDNNIDEIYCSIAETSNKELAEFISFADNNLKVLKFLPDNKEIFTKQLNYEYYGFTPILSLRNFSTEDPFNKLLKRMFDLFFGICAVVFILSWLTPIIAILIKLESNGPVFFKQKRSGMGHKEFNCYKFRSMAVNKDAHLKQATKNDVRVTKIGKFIRKTSIDELPQFYNVLLGDMSVVGPRPHMISHTEKYAKRIDKFMVRHFIKPGITGLAQVRGYRGEIETEKDIVNRVKFDIFYIENWSVLLDLKIVFLTFWNAVKGEDKAY